MLLKHISMHPPSTKPPHFVIWVSSRAVRGRRLIEQVRKISGFSNTKWLNKHSNLPLLTPLSWQTNMKNVRVLFESFRKIPAILLRVLSSQIGCFSKYKSSFFTTPGVGYSFEKREANKLRLANFLGGYLVNTYQLPKTLFPASTKWRAYGDKSKTGIREAGLIRSQLAAKKEGQLTSEVDC